MAHLDPLLSIVDTLKRDNIIPDVLPDSFSPSILLSIMSPSGKEIGLGEEVALEDTLEEPDVILIPLNIPQEQTYSDGGEFGYTLVMVDPDAPSRADPIYRGFRHWVVSTNIHQHIRISKARKYDTQIIEQITGLKLPENSSNSSTDRLVALKTKVSTTPYRPPGPRSGSGIHRYSELESCCWLTYHFIHKML